MAQAMAIQRDALRVLSRKRAQPARAARRASAVPQPDGKALVKKLIEGHVKTSHDLIAVAHELIAGQWIGDATAQAQGRRRSPSSADAQTTEEVDR